MWVDAVAPGISMPIIFGWRFVSSSFEAASAISAPHPCLTACRAKPRLTARAKTRLSFYKPPFIYAGQWRELRCGYIGPRGVADEKLAAEPKGNYDFHASSIDRTNVLGKHRTLADWMPLWRLRQYAGSHCGRPTADARSNSSACTNATAACRCSERIDGRHVSVPRRGRGGRELPRSRQRHREERADPGVHRYTEKLARRQRWASNPYERCGWRFV